VSDFFKNKKVLITGAASGIGKALLIQLLEKGAEVFAVDISDLGLEKLRQEFSEIKTKQVDLAVKGANDQIIKWLDQNNFQIDLVIANAGKAEYGPAKTQKWKEMDALFQLNTFSPIELGMKLQERQASCHHVIIASAMSYWAVPGYSLYAATKSALLQWARTVWSEGGQHLTLVFPIATATAFFDNAGKNIPKAFPVQDPRTVARRILRGLEKGKKRIFPSHLFSLMRLMNKVIPILLPIYHWMELEKLRRWVRNKANSE
jgi:short-subunit dehydrogenase